MKHAMRGMDFLIRNEPNAKIHLVFATILLVAATFLGASIDDWCWFIFCITIVISVEALNTAIERLGDRISPERDPMIRDAKDTAAAAVLWVSIGAAFIGTIRLALLIWRFLERNE